VCEVTVPREQLAAAQARCEAARGPFNTRVGTWQKQAREYDTAHQAVIDRETERVAAARRLLARSEEIQKRLEALRAAIRARKPLMKTMICTQKCSALKGDAASQCLQCCYDGASGCSSLPPVEQKKKPPFQMTSNRTPQQAIEDYKKSGRASPGPTTVKTAAVPPPPPPSK
jgi:hypothetical protein